MPHNIQSKVTLTVTEGPGKGTSFVFSEPDNFLLGRDNQGTKAHFRLSPEDTYVSRNHFLIEINPPDCFIHDAGSLNGTFIIRKNEQAIYFLQGRKEREWEKTAQGFAKRFQCSACTKAEDKVQISNDDSIAVGDTLIAVSIQEEAIKKDAQQFKGLFNCIRCGSGIDAEIFAKDARELASMDFICTGCRHKARPKQAQKLAVACYGCGKDVSAAANADGRAEDLKGVALYLCDTCASAGKGTSSLPDIKNYQMLKTLGEGGFGIVYLARDKSAGRLSAIKITKDKIKDETKLLQRFKREIAIMQEFRHPNLVRLYDEGVTDKGNIYLVSEYVNGGNFSDYLNKAKDKCATSDKGLSWKIPCFAVVSALEGLAHLHKNGFVHRDIKPENILISSGDKDKTAAKVSDFGLAKNYVLRGGTLTRQDDFSGTLFFCPPEQIFDFKNVKPVSDIYAMGITLYYVITGVFPYNFPAKNKFFEMLSIGKKPPDPLSIILGDDKPIPIEKRRDDLPKNLSKAINKAVEKDPSRRFESAGAFQKALSGCLK